MIGDLLFQILHFLKFNFRSRQYADNRAAHYVLEQSHWSSGISLLVPVLWWIQRYTSFTDDLQEGWMSLKLCQAPFLLIFPVPLITLYICTMGCTNTVHCKFPLKKRKKSNMIQKQSYLCCSELYYQEQFIKETWVMILCEIKEKYDLERWRAIQMEKHLMHGSSAQF